MSSTILGILASSGAAAAGSGSFESIATQVGTGSSGTITFNSIPGTFKHLQIRGIYNDGGYNCNLRFNNDSGNNYMRQSLYSYASSSAANGAITQSTIDLLTYGADVTNYVTGIIIDIYNYASTSKNKTVKSFGGYHQNDATGRLFINGGMWLNTGAITRIDILNIYGSYNTNSTFSLYGFKESA